MNKRQVSIITSDNLCGAAEQTISLAASGGLNPVLIIVPDRFTLQAERILLQKRSCVFNARVVTFSMLFNILHVELAEDAEMNVLDKTSAVLYMWRAIQQVKGDLIYFNRSAGHYAFAEKMFNTINQLTSSMVDFDKLEANAKSEITRKKMHDIAKIHAAYKMLIAELTDSSGVLGWLIENIRHSKVIKEAKIFLTGFQHLSIQRVAVINELIKNAKEFTVGIQKGSELESVIGETCFNLGVSLTHKVIDSQESFAVPELRAFETVQEEAVWVANEICRLVRFNNVRFKDIAVVSADYESSSKVFAEVFNENGIAVNLDVGDDLLRSPLTQYLKEHLLLAATGSQMHFLNIMKSLYSKLERDDEFEFENTALKRGQRINEETAKRVKGLQACKTTKEFCGELLKILEPLQEDSIAFRKLLELLETAILVSADQKITLMEFTNMFVTLSGATKISDVPALADAVLLVSVPEYQPSFIKYLFVTGACDGAFPNLQDDTDIINAQDIASAGVCIEPSASLQNARNRRHAKDILDSATCKLYVSYTGRNPSELVEKTLKTISRAEVASKTFAAHTVLKAIGTGEAFEDASYYGGVLKSLDLADMEYLDFSKPLENLKDAQKLFMSSGFARVTQIENFRKCPFYHFLENGLRVRMRERNVVAANILGTVIHKLAEEYTKKIIGIGREGIDDFGADGEMKAILEQVLYIEEFRTMAADPKNAPIISNLKKEAKILAREIVRQIKESDYFPAFAEMPLGGEIDGVPVRGKADRVDASEDSRAIIIDYKTGSVDKESLQLPLYMNFLPEKYSADGAYYHLLKPGSFKVVEAKAADAMQKASEAISGMKKGVIAPCPLNKSVCRYCVARAVCMGGSDE